MQTQLNESKAVVKRSREIGVDKVALFKHKAAAAVDEYSEIVEASEALFDDLCADDEMYRAVTAKAAREICYRACANQVRGRRSASWAAAANELNASQAGRVEAQVRGVREALLMDFPLFGGKLLRDATLPDVEESARKYAELSADMAVKSRWLGAIAVALRSAKTAKPVGEVLTETDLRAMQEEANND